MQALEDTRGWVGFAIIAGNLASPAKTMTIYVQGSGQRRVKAKVKAT